MYYSVYLFGSNYGVQVNSTSQEWEKLSTFFKTVSDKDLDYIKYCQGGGWFFRTNHDPELLERFGSIYEYNKFLFDQFDEYTNKIDTIQSLVFDLTH